MSGISAHAAVAQNIVGKCLFHVEQSARRLHVDLCLRHEIVDEACFICAVSVFAARSVADGVDARLAVKAPVGRACPGDEILRLFTGDDADAFLDRLHERGMLVGDVCVNEIAGWIDDQGVGVIGVTGASGIERFAESRSRRTLSSRLGSSGGRLRTCTLPERHCGRHRLRSC